MTDEELEQEIQNLTENIAKLSESGVSLTKEEKRQKYVLPLQKEALLNVKEAREKKNESREFKNMAMYGLLKSFEKKHPLVMQLALSKFRWNLF